MSEENLPEAYIPTATIIMSEYMDIIVEQGRELKEKDAQIKSQEATIDALLAQNQTQMLEIEKLEAWQEEAVFKLQFFKDNLKPIYSILAFCYDTEFEQLSGLIKQARENGK